jgi:quercetin dioxygenase-like cupin family protein
MNRKINYQFFLAISISLTFISCNQHEEKTGETATTDSTGNAKTETAQPTVQNMANDAVKVAPDLYKVASDTLGIRVLEVTYKPGDTSALHAHPDLAAYAISESTVEFTEKDGTKHTNEFKPGMIMFSPRGEHSVKNTGKTTLKVLLVEVKRSQGTTSPDAAMDATKIAPTLYKLKKDTMGIRVLEVTYKPGDASALHAHPDNAVYVISGGTVEFTEKDGTKHTNEFKPGMIMVRPGGEHSVKNTGKTTLKVLLVEVNRPREIS